MTTVLLRIFLHGLIALVPMDDGSNRMRALLVDARKPPDVSAHCVAAHSPELRFLTSAAECLAAASVGCQIVGDYCSCAVERQEIVLSASVRPITVTFNTQPSRRLPKTPGEQAAETSYMANVLNLPHVSLNPDMLSLTPPPPKAVLDRMTFAFDSIETCMLAGKNIPGGAEVHTFSFGRAGEPTGSMMRQAIADMMAAKATVPFDATNKVIVSVTGFDAPTSFSMSLIPEPCDPTSGSSDQCVDITLANVRPSLPLGPNGCDDGVGRDFAFFYELVKDPPPWEARLVPIDDKSDKIDASLLEIPECKNHPKGPMNRPICGMASFIP
jgi:hypothetical protein